MRAQSQLPSEDLHAISSLIKSSRPQTPKASCPGSEKEAVRQLAIDVSQLVHDSDEIAALEHANRKQLEETVCEARWISDLDLKTDSTFRQDTLARVQGLAKHYRDVTPFTKHLQIDPKRKNPKEQQKILIEAIAPKLKELYPVYRKLSAVNNKLISPLPISCHGGNAPAPFPELEVMAPDDLRKIQKDLLGDYEALFDDLPLSGHPFAKRFYLDSMSAMEPVEKAFCQRRENTFNEQKFISSALDEAGENSFQKNVIDRMKFSNAADLNTYQNFGKRGEGFFAEDYQKFLVQMGAFENETSEKVAPGAAKLNKKYSEERRQKLQQMLGEYSAFADSMDVLCLAPPPAPPQIVLLFALICEGYEIVDTVKTSYENNCSPDSPLGYRENICDFVANPSQPTKNPPHFQGSAVDSQSCVLQTSGEIALAATPYAGKVGKAARKSSKLVKKASKGKAKALPAKLKEQKLGGSKPDLDSIKIQVGSATSRKNWYRDLAENEAREANSRAVRRRKALDKYYSNLDVQSPLSGQVAGSTDLLRKMTSLVDQDRKRKLTSLLLEVDRKDGLAEAEARVASLLEEATETTKEFRRVVMSLPLDRRGQLDKVGDDLIAEKLQIENLLAIIKQAKEDPVRLEELKVFIKRSHGRFLSRTKGNLGELDLFMRLPSSASLNARFSKDPRNGQIRASMRALATGDFDKIYENDPLVRFVDQNLDDQVLINLPTNTHRRDRVMQKLEMVLNKQLDVVYRDRMGQEIWAEVKNSNLDDPKGLKKQLQLMFVTARVAEWSAPKQKIKMELHNMTSMSKSSQEDVLNYLKKKNLNLVIHSPLKD